MDNNSDSDNSYEKISWDEFGVTLSDSDPEEIAKVEILVKKEIDSLDSEKSLNEFGLTLTNPDPVESVKDETSVKEEIGGSDSNKSQNEKNEFGATLSDSNPEESAKDEKFLKEEMDGSDSEKSQNEEKVDIGVKRECFSGNSSYDTDSTGEDLSESGGDLDPNNVFDVINCAKPGALAASFKRKCSLLVPGAFDFPSNIKLRENMQIKDLVKEHALPFLPAKSLARFKAVSKEWNQWISSPFLAHKQSYLFRNLSGFFCQGANRVTPSYISIDNISSGIRNPSLGFLPEKVFIRSSCFGLLLCQAVENENDYYVCNPVNTEYRKIPKPSFYHGDDPAIVLAFEPSEINIEAHFEIICAVPLLEYPMVYFEIYSSETKEWRLSTCECIEVEDSKFLGGGFYVNKIAYFVTDSGYVLGFDVKSEFCGVLSLPPDCEWKGVLTRMDGELSYVHACHNPDEDEGESEYDVSVYKGMDMGFKRQIGLVLNSLGVGSGTECRVLPFVTNNGNDVVILARKMLWVYYMRDDRGKVVGSVWDFEAKYLPFVSSLVHLPPE